MAKNSVQKVSITYQDLAEKREQLEKLAKDMGYTRLKDGQAVGELSPILGLATEFIIANLDVFREWVAQGKPVIDYVKHERKGKIIFNRAPLHLESE